MDDSKTISNTLRDKFVLHLSVITLLWMRPLFGYVWGMLDDYGVIVNIFFAFLIILCIVPFLKQLRRCITMHHLVFICFVVLSFVITLVGSKAKIACRDEVVTFFTTVFPYYFVGITLPYMMLDDGLMDRLSKISIVIVLSAFIYIFYYIYTGRDWAGAEQMQKAYLNLPHILLVVNYAFRKPNAFRVFVAIIGFAYLLACGTRGALVALAAWFLYCFLFKTNGRTTIKVLVSLAIILVLVFGNVLFVFLYTHFGALGLNVRIFESFDNSNFLDPNGRDALFSLAVSNFSVFPGGLYYDRVIRNYLGYIHNIVLEFFLDFGVILGTILLLLLAYYLIRAIRCAPSNDSKDMISMLSVMFFVMLMVSSSFLNESYFFLLLGMASVCQKKPGSASALNRPADSLRRMR